MGSTGKKFVHCKTSSSLSTKLTLFLTLCLMLLLTDSSFFPLDTQFVVVKEILTESLQVSLLILWMIGDLNPGQCQKSCRMTPEKVLTSLDNFLYLPWCE